MLRDQLIAGINDNLFQLDGLKNGADSVFVNDAVVNVVIKDSGGNEIPGMTWPAAMNYVTDSKGQYQLLLSSSLNLMAGNYYTLSITATAGGLTASWVEYKKAVKR